LLARNSADWLQIRLGMNTLWLDKRHQRVVLPTYLARMTLARRPLAMQLRRMPHTIWQTQADAYGEGLGIDRKTLRARGLHVVAEPSVLVCQQYDAYGRLLWLHADAQRAWSQMRSAAAEAGIVLRAVSGWRSIHYQAQLLLRKLQLGQTLAQILAVSAAPGYSEHHAGTALDLAGAAELALEERFEHSMEFAWLQQHAGRFGFVLSLPRGNPYGYTYEPWHWRWTAAT
jgi:D-alanyl-D-alanine carboxypeptidase